MLPVGSVLMQSNFTPRSGRHSNCPNNGLVVSIGQQMMTRKMHHDWDVNFFQRPIEEIDQFGEDLTRMLMLKTPFDITHFKELHKLGYLPLEFRAMTEGERIPYKIPLSVIVNTKPLNGGVFDWLVNYLETINSAESWHAPTSATLSYALRLLSTKWILKTDKDNLWFADYQNHDFSMRGMSGKSSIINSGIGFSSCSRGSDTLPIIPAVRMYYDEPLNEVAINSVIASEHAIMCSLTGFFIKTKKGTWERVGDFEIETFRYLLKTFPSGILSLVSDTWDLWRVITEYCRILKDEILARDGKLVIRPDSGDPVDIICGFDIESFDSLEEAIDNFEDTLGSNQIHGEMGFECDTEITVKVGDKYYELNSDDIDWNRHDKQYYFVEEYNIGSKEVEAKPSYKGVVELLWDIFGGTVNSQGYKCLDPHIGAIYGDSITYKRAEQIYIRLEVKGFASTNIVLGVGSYSLQCVTRDTHGMAQKATYIEIEVDGEVEGINIFKDPITDDGTKKSATGLIRVVKIDGTFVIEDKCTWDQVNSEENELKVIFRDGKHYNQTTYTKIREKLNASVLIDAQSVLATA